MKRADAERLLDLARLGMIHAPDDRLGYSPPQEAGVRVDNALLARARAELLPKKKGGTEHPGTHPA
jgi:hypothetical protein